jgi:hypothetical protein
MAKRIEGYVRDHPGGTPIPNVDVTVRDDVTGSPILSGGMVQASQNPTITNQDGLFVWSTELSPGPLRVEADINAGVEVKVRSGREVMQAGDIFVSDIPAMLGLFSIGVFRGVGTDLRVDAITGQRAIRVNPGAANMVGRYLQIDTNREIAISENPTLATRIDLVVLEQHVGGDYIGKQNITVIEGTVNNTQPPTNADPDVFQLPVGKVTILQNGSTVTVEDVRIYSAPLSIGEDTVGLPALKQEVLDYITSQYPGFVVKDGGTDILTTTKKLNFKTGFTVVANGADQVDIDVDGIDPVVQTTGKYHKTTNFAYSGAAGAERTLGSASVTVPAGTWMAYSVVATSLVGGASPGYTRLRLSGNGTAQGSEQSTRAFNHGSNDVRQVILMSWRVLTVATTTTLTATATVLNESGTQAEVMDGHVSLMVV